ncbi:MAG: hypothetical protein AAF944_04985 [Bacteroidota bacterium]
MILRWWLFIFFLGLPIAGFSQEYVDPEYRQLMMKMDEGVVLMNQGDYYRADSYFQEVLTNIDVIPAELCFYFGKNSYHLKKYKQSIDWLNKYIEIKGTTGQFFDQAKEYLALSETDFLAQQRNSTPRPIQPAKAQPQQIDCNTTPFVLCPVCKGSGVIIEQGTLGSAIYRTCPYSDGSGRMSCEDYQKYLKGDLSISP